ncbi:MAG: hypothetical protein JO227_16190 [Acetobacteraceae bacterium]|nr:hypothetical protein [Acetobacteraceae bacterium]
MNDHTLQAARRAEVKTKYIGLWVRRYVIGRKAAGRLRTGQAALARILAVSRLRGQADAP